MRQKVDQRAPCPRSGGTPKGSRHGAQPGRTCTIPRVEEDGVRGVSENCKACWCRGTPKECSSGSPSLIELRNAPTWRELSNGGRRDRTRTEVREGIAETYRRERVTEAASGEVSTYGVMK